MFLETKRLLLREMNPEDYDALFRVLGDREDAVSQTHGYHIYLA